MIEEKKTLLNLSIVLAECQEYYKLQSKTTSWCLAILSFFDKNYEADLRDDLTSTQKITLVRLITETVASTSSFYEQEKPNSIFRVFTFMSRVFDLNAECTDYGFVLSKVTFLNALAIYSIKVGQYSYALEVYDQLLDIYKQKLIDSNSEIFLTILSNYLTLLKRSSKKMASKMFEVQGLLKQLFFKYLTKFILIERENPKGTLMNIITLLSGIYHQHEPILTKYSEDLNALIVHTYQQNRKLLKKLPQNMIDFLVKEQIRKKVAFQLNFNLDQLNFYSRNRYRDMKQLKRGKEEVAELENRMKNMEHMLQQVTEMLQEQKMISARNSIRRQLIDKSVTLDRYATFNKSTIESQSDKKTIQQPIEKKKTPRRIQSLPRSFTKRKQILSKQPTKNVPKWGKKCKNIKFKIFSIFIDVYQDGILLSDYTNQNKRYIEWNTISKIMQKLQHQFVFKDFIKNQVQNYYDIVRILALYLTKNDNRDICLRSQPIPLLEINFIIKLYKQEGKYLKLALMNHFDHTKFIGVVDLYLSQYSQFFKQLTQNQYMMLLNDRISSRMNQKGFERDNFYNLDYLKKKRETTVADLGKFLDMDCLQRAIEEKGYLYKSILILKNNNQVLVQIVDNIKTPIPEDFKIRIKIQSLQKYSNNAYYPGQAKTGKKIDRQVSVPLQLITRYFPLFDSGLKEYLSIYSKMIVDTLSIQNYLGEVNLGGITFGFTTIVLKTQMIEYGKYFSVVTAELVGSKERVWALVIKYYDMAHLNYKVTVMMNPYHDFLEHIINGTKEEQAQVMKNMLIGESVKQTVNWLKKNDQLQKRINLFEYLSSNKLI